MEERSVGVGGREEPRGGSGGEREWGGAEEGRRRQFALHQDDQTPLCCRGQEGGAQTDGGWDGAARPARAMLPPCPSRISGVSGLDRIGI